LPAQQACGNALDEWKEARSVLERFDNNLHDLRKYGFSFITALLAANGLISIGGTSPVPLEVKVSILVVTMGLIVTLKLLDSHYQCFESAASARCRILEDRLNLELTGDIAYFYKSERWWAHVIVLYLGFVILTTILGAAILWNTSPLLLYLVVIAAVISILLIILTTAIKSSNKDLQDWAVDLKIVSQGIPVRISYTNLNSREKKLPGLFKIWWTVKPFDDENSVGKPSGPPVKIVSLKYFQNHVWLWDTSKMSPGLYEFEMFSVRLPRDDLLSQDKKINANDEEAACRWIIQLTSVIKNVCEE
jgi:hypothetical protein